MTYMCPFCLHQQPERRLCKRCSFDLASNPMNPVCSKCKIKFTSMEELKFHFNSCTFSKGENLEQYFKRCLECGINYYSEAMFNIHMSEIHQINEEKVCTVCYVGRIIDTECNVCNKSVDISLSDNKIDPPTMMIPKDQMENSENNEKVNLFQCQLCTKVFTQYPIYQKHILNKWCQDELLQCSKCKKRFANKHSRDNHVLQNVCENEKHAKCYFENCNVRCMKRGQLYEHLKACHGVDIKYEIKKFPSFKDFELWKDDFGMRSLTFYSLVSRGKHITKDDKEIESISYSCSFDMQRAVCLKHKLSNRPNKKRKVRFDLNESTVCTSRINVRVLPDNRVLASVCAEHNHVLSLEHLKVQKLPKNRRQFLTNAFVMGASIEEVMDLLQQEAKESNIMTKESSLPRRFFKEIQRKSLVKHSIANDMQAVTQFVEDLKTENGVLIYKSGSETFNIEEELPEDVFMLGIQTERMLDMLETCGDVVYIEGLHHLSAYPDHKLFNILLTDESGYVLPVAHFITNASSEEHVTLMFASLKPRVQNCNVKNLVVQSDNNLDKALAGIFNNETTFINQWDLSCIDISTKKYRGSQNFEFAVLVDDEDDQEDMSPEQLQKITEQTVAASDDCVLQFHKDMRSKFRRSHGMFILLNELMAYFKKKYSIKFNLTVDEDSNKMMKFLKQMRRRLFDYHEESQVEKRENAMFDEQDNAMFDEQDNAMFDEQENAIFDKQENHMFDEIEETLSNIDDEADSQSYLVRSETMDELGEDFVDEFASDSEDSAHSTDDKEILKEIIVANTAVSKEDDSSIHLLKEYQKSIIQLLEKHPLARPLMMRSVLEDTKSIYEQVQVCCNETTNLSLFNR